MKGNDGSVSVQKSSGGNCKRECKGQDDQDSDRVVYEGYRKHGEDSGCGGQQRHKWSDLGYEEEQGDQETQQGRMQTGWAPSVSQRKIGKGWLKQTLSSEHQGEECRW